MTKRLTRRVSLVEQELLTLPEHLSSPPVLSGVRVTRSLVLCICFVNRCLYFFFVLSVLRYTGSDYLPLVSSNSSANYFYLNNQMFCFKFVGMLYVKK